MRHIIHTFVEFPGPSRMIFQIESSLKIPLPTLGNCNVITPAEVKSDSELMFKIIKHISIEGPGKVHTSPYPKNMSRILCILRTNRNHDSEK